VNGWDVGREIIFYLVICLNLVGAKIAENAKKDCRGEVCSGCGEKKWIRGGRGWREV